jgi:hypothetical protein
MARRFRLASSAVVLVLGGLALALVVAGLPLGAMAHQLDLSDQSGAVVFLAGVAVGAVVAWHQPRNPVGWILLAAMGFFTVTTDASFYSVADYRLHHGTLPLGPVAVLLQPTWAPGIVLLGLAILLFPDGRVPSPSWRWVLWVYLTAGVLWLAGAFTVAAVAVIGHNIHVDSSGSLQAIGPGGFASWWAVVEVVLIPVPIICWLASLAGQAASWRRSSGERRQQLKWLLGGSATCLIGLVLAVWLGNESGFLGVVSLAGFLAITALPVTMGVAILKYRLYDIDRIISRTLAYAIVTGVLVGVYAGVVLLATRVLPLSSPVAVAGATLLAAALFTPLRRHVQNLVDHRFNRARYDADKTVAAFAARLQDAVNLAAVQADLAGVVHQALEPTHVSVWISQGD